MKKLIIILISLLLTSCSHDMNRREIDEINIIHVLGIDYEEEEYKVSVLYSAAGGADPEEGEGSGDEELLSGKGRTPYEALEDVKLKSKKNITLAHTGNFLIGEEAALSDIRLCLDFLSRDETIKMESLFYVTQGISAKDFIEESIDEKQNVQEDLEAIKQKQHELLTRYDNTLVNILNEIKQNKSSLLIPYLVSEDKTYLINGYAVFDNYVLIDYLDKETSYGVDFIKDALRDFPIFLEDEVSLSLSYSKTKLKSEIIDRQIKVYININFETMVREIITNENIFNREKIEELTDEQNKYVQERLEKVVNYSVDNGVDILQIARLVEKEHVNQWADIEDNWDEIIADIEYEINLDSKIGKSFILGKGR